MRTVCKLGKCPEFCAGRRLSSAWPRTLGAGCNVSQPTRSSAAFDRAVARLIDEPPHTVMHGDAHTGNVYFRNGAAGLLDWQAVRRGHPGRELAYTLVTGMTTADHRRHGRHARRGHRHGRPTAKNRGARRSEHSDASEGVAVNYDLVTE